MKKKKSSLISLEFIIFFVNREEKKNSAQSEYEFVFIFVGLFVIVDICYNIFFILFSFFLLFQITRPFLINTVMCGIIYNFL